MLVGSGDGRQDVKGLKTVELTRWNVGRIEFNGRSVDARIY